MNDLARSRLTFALAVAGALPACGRLRFDDRGVRDGALGGDGAGDSALDAPPPCTFGAWSAPVHETTVSAVGSLDSGPSMSGDGLSLAFASDREDGSNLRIYLSERATTADAWPAPTVVSIGGTEVLGDDPQITDDGLTLMWTTEGSVVIATSSRPARGGAWAAYHTLLGDGVLYTSAQAPSLSADGRSLYFTATTRATGLLDMYVTTRLSTSDGFPNASAVPGVDPAIQAEFGSVAVGGLDLVYQEEASYEIYEATRLTTTDPFGSAIVPAVFAGDQTAVDPDLSSDGTTLWYGSTITSSDYDLYESTRPCT